MIKEKKVYPSQINTKAIACRIPANDYVKFLQDAINKNISLSDWLLMKIYSDKAHLSENYNQDSEDIDWDKHQIVGNSYLANYHNFVNDVEENFGIYMDQETGKPYHLYYFQNEVNFSIMESIECRSLADLEKAITLDAIAIDKEKNKKEVTLSDVRAQLIILAENTFESSKDVREFMKEINEVLTDLED